jgi:hypothetical protein
MSLSLIKKQMLRFAEHAAQWQFSSIDYTEERGAGLPAGYNLIYVQDTLQNLPCKRIVGALRNFANANGAKNLLIENHLVDGNCRFRSHGHYLINWLEEPFELVNYLEIKSEKIKV